MDYRNNNKNERGNFPLDFHIKPNEEEKVELEKFRKKNSNRFKSNTSNSLIYSCVLNIENTAIRKKNSKRLNQLKARLDNSFDEHLSDPDLPLLLQSGTNLSIEEKLEYLDLISNNIFSRTNLILEDKYKKIGQSFQVYHNSNKNSPKQIQFKFNNKEVNANSIIQDLLNNYHSYFKLTKYQSYRVFREYEAYNIDYFVKRWFDSFLEEFEIVDFDVRYIKKIYDVVSYNIWDDINNYLVPKIKSLYEKENSLYEFYELFISDINNIFELRSKIYTIKIAFKKDFWLDFIFRKDIKLGNEILFVEKLVDQIIRNAPHSFNQISSKYQLSLFSLYCPRNIIDSYLIEETLRDFNANLNSNLKSELDLCPLEQKLTPPTIHKNLHDIINILAGLNIDNLELSILKKTESYYPYFNINQNSVISEIRGPKEII